MNLDDALQTFLVESRELLEEMENALLIVVQAEEKDDLVNAIFRAAHTIKGSAGLFGLDPIVAFTHVLESVLDQVRAGKIELDDKLVMLLLSCADHIGELVRAVAKEGAGAHDALPATGEPLLALLSAYLAPPADLPVALWQEDEQVHRIHEGSVHADHWHISLRFGPEVLKNGMDPLSGQLHLNS